MIWYAIAVVLAGFCGITGFIVWSTFKPFFDRGELDAFPWWVRAVVYFWSVVGVVSDAFMNLFLMTPRHLDPPKELLVTSRLKRYRETSDRRLPRVKRGWSWLNLLDKDHW